MEKAHSYIIWTMSEDEENVLFLEYVDWDVLDVSWTEDEDMAGVFFYEEFEALNDDFDNLHAEPLLRK
jgi:hypothetical protein